MQVNKYIEVSPEICHGKPCFKGTRILVRTVIEMLADGNGEKEILQAFPNLTPEHIEAARTKGE